MECENAVMGRKLTLINSILNSIPIYAMSVLPVPKKVILQIQRSISDFLWNQGENTRHHWVAWEKVTKPIEEGGLNLKLLADVSYYWRSKLAWSFIQKKSLWATFMKQKYNIGSNSSSDSKLWKGLEPICSDLLDNSFWKVGEGSVSFWEQKWWPMDSITVVQNELQDDLLKNIWNEDSRKQIYIEALPAELQTFAAGIQLMSVPDQLIWKPSEDGSFSSRHYRLYHSSSNHSIFSWWKNFWNKWIPSKCSCFLWKCLNYVVPVDEAIQKMHIPLASKCICCKNGHIESLDHLILFSDTAKEVWDFLQKFFGMNFHFQNISQAAFLWVSGTLKSQFGCLKTLAFILAVWEIWKWRNRCIFEKPESPSSIKVRITQQLQQYNFLIKPSRKASWSEEIAISSLHIPVLKPEAKTGCWLSWSPHPYGLTMNIHSKFIRNNSQGCYLVRDSKGSIIESGRWALNNEEDHFRINLFSLETALEAVRAKGLKLAEIQGDSSKLIDCIKGARAAPWSCIDRVEAAKKQCRGILLKRIESVRNQAAIELIHSSDEGEYSRKFNQAVREDKERLARWSWL